MSKKTCDILLLGFQNDVKESKPTSKGNALGYFFLSTQREKYDHQRGLNCSINRSLKILKTSPYRLAHKNKMI